MGGRDRSNRLDRGAAVRPRHPSRRGERPCCSRCSACASRAQPPPPGDWSTAAERLSTTADDAGASLRRRPPCRRAAIGWDDGRCALRGYRRLVHRGRRATFSRTGRSAAGPISRRRGGRTPSGTRSSTRISPSAASWPGRSSSSSSNPRWLCDPLTSRSTAGGNDMLRPRTDVEHIADAFSRVLRPVRRGGCDDDPPLRREPQRGSFRWGRWCSAEGICSPRR